MYGGGGGSSSHSASSVNGIYSGGNTVTSILFLKIPEISLYCCRVAGDHYRILKSACKFEGLQLGNNHRLEAYLSIDLVMEWRIVPSGPTGAETPAVPCMVFFEEHELKALITFQPRTPMAPDALSRTLREATQMKARLGGF